MNWLGVALVACSSLISGCSSSTASASNLPPGYYISISNMAFSPVNLAAPPGATITVLNNDPYVHSVTSESASAQYVPGSVGGISFDTGQFTGQASFTLPASAPNGTLIPYYCSVHKSTMATPTGTITVDSSAQPQQAPGGGGTVGGGYGY